MKKIIFIFIVLVVAINTYSQQAFQTFAADTSKGVQTKSETTGSIVKYNGVVTFNFTASKDTCNGGIKFQGSNDAGTTWNLISTTAHNTDATVDYIVTQSPPQFLAYRLTRTGAAADTSILKKVIFIYKK